mgnify:CR=1 FL=1
MEPNFTIGTAVCIRVPGIGCIHHGLIRRRPRIIHSRIVLLLHLLMPMLCDNI